MYIRRPLLTVLAALLLATSWAGSAAAQGKKKIAILGLEVLDAGGGIDAKTTQLANQITDALRKRANQRVGAYSLAPHSEKDLLEMKLLSSCSDEAEACMANIGRDLEADTLLYGKIQKLQDGYQVSLTILDVKTKTKQAMTARLSVKDAQSEKEIARWSSKNYDRVTGVPQEGTLVVKANVDSGTVFVEGEVKGTLVGGAVRINGISAGKREVAVESPGHKRYTTAIDIKVGEVTSVDAELEAGALVSVGGQEGPKDGGRPGGVWRIATWGFAAATLAAGAGIVIQGLKVRSIEDETGKIADGLSMEEKEMLDPGDACEGVPAGGAFDALRGKCDDGKSAATLVNVFIGVTVGMGVATAISYYLGYVSPDPVSSKEQAGRTRRSRQRTVEVAPVVTPTYTGGAVVIEF